MRAMVYLAMNRHSRQLEYGDFQQIVAQGISPQLLEWKGIEATETLAKSANSKIVVIGNAKNGLPLILGQ